MPAFSAAYSFSANCTHSRKGSNLKKRRGTIPSHSFPLPNVLILLSQILFVIEPTRVNRLKCLIYLGNVHSLGNNEFFFLGGGGAPGSFDDCLMENYDKKTIMKKTYVCIGRLPTRPSSTRLKRSTNDDLHQPERNQDRNRI